MVSRQGALVYHPHGQDTDASELTIALDAILRGDRAFVVHTLDYPQPQLRNGHDVVLEHAGGRCRECYVPRGDGIEQKFVLEDLPRGAGDLTFVLSISTRGMAPVQNALARHGGVSFIAEDGRIAVRYGQVVVRDSSGRGIPLEPGFDNGKYCISFSIPETWLVQAALPIEVDPLVGNNLTISSASQYANTVAPPTIAAGGTNFLIAWVDYSAGVSQPVVAAATLSQSGMTSAPFQISNSGAAPRPFRFQRIQAAYDGTNWLVVWSDDRASSPGIRGSLVTATGSVVGGQDFLIATSSGSVEEDPLVVFNGIDYVVAWQDLAQTSSGSQVYYERVSTAGTESSIQVISSSATSPAQALFFLAPQLPSGDTLALYRDSGVSPAMTRGVLIAPDGTIRNAGGTALFKQNLSDGGFGTPIGVSFSNGYWNILSSFDQTVDSSVYLHKFGTDGTVVPPSGTFVEMGLGPTGSSGDSYAPVFGGVGEWLFVRNEEVNSSLFHLLGKRATADGQDRDPVPFQVDTATQGVLRNGVAAQSGNYYAVAWLDGRRGSSQSADAVEIQAAIIDSTVTGSTGSPLVANISASPTAGPPPLTVYFSSALSQGNYDTLRWDFGDGTTATTADAVHTYKTKGTFVAQLKLTQGAYVVCSTVLIAVGTGVWSDVPMRIGTPVQNTTDLVPELFIQTFNVNLNFRTAGKDSVTISGVLDNGALPNDLTGVVCSVSIGSYTTSFNLDASGQFKSDATKTPYTSFALVKTTGHFLFSVINANLVAAMDVLGLKNETVVSSDLRIITVPVSISISGLSATARCGIQYIATQDNVGTGTCLFQKKGHEVSGSFLITKFAAKESTQKATGSKVYTFAIQGQLIQPNAAPVVSSATGLMTFAIGNYAASVPGAVFTSIKNSVAFKGKSAVAGLSKFTLNSKGKFTLKLINVPALDSGLPTANSDNNMLNVDLNLSFQFDLSDGTQLSAGRFILIDRATVGSKSWVLVQ